LIDLLIVKLGSTLLNEMVGPEKGRWVNVPVRQWSVLASFMHGLLAPGQIVPLPGVCDLHGIQLALLICQQIRHLLAMLLQCMEQQLLLLAP
jgi:hypothetical protein